MRPHMSHVHMLRSAGRRGATEQQGQHVVPGQTKTASEAAANPHSSHVFAAPSQHAPANTKAIEASKQSHMPCPFRAYVSQQVTRRQIGFSTVCVRTVARNSFASTIRGGDFVLPKCTPSHRQSGHLQAHHSCHWGNHQHQHLQPKQIRTRPHNRTASGDALWLPACARPLPRTSTSTHEGVTGQTRTFIPSC